MRWLLAVVLALVFCWTAAAQFVPPPMCTAFSPTVYVDSPVLAGAHFTAAATCSSSNATECRCIPGNNNLPDNYNQYPATWTYVMDGETCTCTFEVVRDTPANVMTLRACAICA